MNDAGPQREVSEVSNEQEIIRHLIVELGAARDWITGNRPHTTDAVVIEEIDLAILTARAMNSEAFASPTGAPNHE